MMEKEKLYDVIIIGAGPAGLTAALYLSRTKYRVLVVEKEQFGGQITITEEVVNYPGVGRCSGKELTHTMYQQARYFGADFLLAKAEGFEIKEDIKTVHTDKGDYDCFGILFAMGAHPRMVGFQGEEQFRGRGVAYCATCDGEFFTGKEIFVIGGGFAAAEESVFLTKFASHVTILIRGEDFTCAKSAADKARNHPDITVVTQAEVEEVRGENYITYIRYRHLLKGDTTEYQAKEGDSFGVFVFAGYEPETGMVKDLVTLDEQGYIVTDNTQKTSVDGLYAAGDLCIKPLRQVVTATRDGAIAATELEKYILKVYTRTKIRAKEPTVREEVWKELEGAKGSSDRVENKAMDNAQETFSDTMRAQLKEVFERMERSLVFKFCPDERQVSEELKLYLENLCEMTEKLSMEALTQKEEYSPCVKLYCENKYTGLAFHGVPGGHEFTSFVLGIYNAAGPGQALDEEIRKRIRKIDTKIDMKLLVSLSCTMCPELVAAAQHIAAENEKITAEVYDIAHFEELKNKYKVMSVPCMVINDEQVFFGKKTMVQLLEILETV